MDLSHPFASSANLAQLKQSADAIQEISDNEVYLCFCIPGCSGTDQPQWSILQILTSSSSYPKVTTFKWAAGQCFYDLVFDNYASYTYMFKTF